ncbi:hypothetical protein BV509_13420 [Rhodovulum sulfidophilum]|uniref:LysR family transcriptional regulator n=1 Tax=Rhodovulum visakhapatnamense TaxID=364297 RepID=A0ABS1RFN4_9RHOB|nr:LysR family transcriptional regulator [Rhodovulum visakhapatnamense]MBL3569614.1 LysR family transcriptional regulator [Rhodovulum visakhapatnamense]MBL3578467.1 LysR family transcriptional regulator [Rhodovulum visakhapatnamense]OLS45242.1 hypothetical protein BV509_13420 [Rhodovulum sulfidophilum]
MDLVDGLRTFVAVAESGSFTRAGEQLGITNKVASKYVAALEERLGHVLFYRTTRAVSLTHEGTKWLPHARKVLAALEEADSALRDPADGLSGRLRLTCGTTMGELVVADAVRGFLDENPAMQVELHLSDALADLAAGGFDLAVRIGIPQDSSLKMRRIGTTRLCVAASPAYLARAGRPQHPRVLEGHTALLDLNEHPAGRWQFRDANGPLTVTVSGRFAVNSASQTIRAALAGEGVMRAPDIFLAPHLASGALVELLPGHGTAAHPLNLLTLPTAFRLEKVDAFAAVLKRHLAGLGSDTRHPAP